MADIFNINEIYSTELIFNGGGGHAFLDVNTSGNIFIAEADRGLFKYTDVGTSAEYVTSSSISSRLCKSSSEAVFVCSDGQNISALNPNTFNFQHEASGVFSDWIGVFENNEDQILVAGLSQKDGDVTSCEMRTYIYTSANGFSAISAVSITDFYDTTQFVISNNREKFMVYDWSLDLVSVFNFPTSSTLSAIAIDQSVADQGFDGISWGIDSDYVYTQRVQDDIVYVYKINTGTNTLDFFT